ncbi:MAG: glycoside hydrolase family 44 protein [bacterium]
MKKHLLIVFFVVWTVALYAINITINTNNTRLAISPYIYGTNQQMEGDENLTIMRLGGNRMTGYNWENNASNSGRDWEPAPSTHYSFSDYFMCSNDGISNANCDSQPGIVLKKFVDYNIAHNYASIITLPMAGYTSADKNGEVTVAESAPSARWKIVLPKKGSAFVYPPDVTDNYVYDDEEVAWLVSLYGNAWGPNGVKFYQLDNEGDIWDGSHPRIHPTPVGAAEWVNRGIDLSKAVKDVDQYAQMMGPVFFGVWSMISQGSDWNTVKGTHAWYVEYYLDKMKQASVTDGRRLLDVIDIHYYTEAREGLTPPFNYSSGQCRITEDACTSTLAQQTRLQAPRSLWDSTFTENSSVGEWCGVALPIIPKVQQAIDTYYPGTKISFTEHAFGGGNDFSGGIATADALGIYGKYGVYVATLWKTAYGLFHSAAYKLFRNYDGSKSTYGDTKVYCESNDIPNMTTYASINGTDDSVLHIIVLNKASTAQTANVSITSPQTYMLAEAWAFGGASSTITARTAPSLSGNSFSYSVPAYSAFHFVLKTGGTPTNTPNWTATPTFTITKTFTATQTYTSTPVVTAAIIYDGDTAGATISDGTIGSSAPGVMSQTTGGNPANMMLLTYTTVTGWWQQHTWTLNNPKSTAGQMYLTFNVKQDSSSANPVIQFDVGVDPGNTINLDVATYLVEGGAVTTTWKTVLIPLSVLLGVGQTTINYIKFTNNYSNDYVVDVDNVKIIPNTITPTITQTPIGSATYTKTVTQTNIQTITQTITQTVNLTGTQTVIQTGTQTFTYTSTPINTITRTITLTVTKTLLNTPTNTPIISSTATITITLTQQDTATPVVPTATATVASVNVIAYPNPINPDLYDLKLGVDVVQASSSIKALIYTRAFRLVKVIELGGSSSTGIVVKTINKESLKNLATGTYLYIVKQKGLSGLESKSKIKMFVLIR